MKIRKHSRTVKLSVTEFRKRFHQSFQQNRKMTIETSLGEFKSKSLESCIDTLAVTIQLAGIFGVNKEFQWPVKKSWIFNLKAFFKIESCPATL